MSEVTNAVLTEVASLNPREKLELSPDEVVSFVPMSAVCADTGTIAEEESRQFQEVSKGFTPFLDSDVLVAKITPCFQNGKIAHANITKQYGFGSTEFHVIRPNPDVLDSRYVFHFLRQPVIRIAGERRMTGSAGQRRVPKQFLARLKIPVPPLDEQKRIAEVLDRAEALRARRRAALALLDELTQSIFLDMFGDPVVNPRGLEKKKVSEIATVVTGNTPSRKQPEYYGDHIEWIKSDNINGAPYFATKAEEYLSESGLEVGRSAPSESVLITCIAGSPSCIGNAAMVDRQVAFNQQINALVNPNANPHFLYMQLVVGKKLVQRVSSNGMKGIVSKGRLEGVELVIPRESEQDEFAARSLTVEALKRQHSVALRCLDELFASLQSRAFKGELF